ncbi:TonB-dependent receptor plug domain-containing protein [Mucilaginibacter sp. RB4R14]|uniref:TonB-dependent receptor plug domain-containing protein n=1 Tax=Mucilaginibacter aurantiaciroseus TaxID=2949308 RepID=UPI002091CEE2|nr:TonB-dependent receptor plug domain-containing protein [Mucilaginibacter aurantiaciroseus]MCO5937335.1 TonB-dependent receptor plug domain-containing protein [Mucilaginibacter aurantiaciroseus]
MAYKRIIAGLLLAIGSIGAFSFSADDDIIATVQRQLDKWTGTHPTEKVHLQFDKPYYAAGDDIWFKAYVITGPQHRLQPDSGILNVELIDDQDAIKQNIKLQVRDGLAYGDFALPDTLHKGNYRIRAYTQYMLNAGSDYFFDKAISITNILTNKVFTKTTFTSTNQNGRNAITADINYTDANGAAYSGNAVIYSIMLNNAIVTKGKGVTDANGNLYVNLPADNAELLKSGRIVTGLSGTGQRGMVYKSIPIRAIAGHADVQFFPEGGVMVNGIETKVAFKAIGTDGLGVDIKGTVTDSKGKQVATLNTAHLGMGLFDFTPGAGNTYKANLIYADGSKASVNLPTAADNGFVLNISTFGPDLKVVVSTTKQNSAQFSLIGKNGGKVYYAAKSKPGSTAFSATVAKNKFPSGIAQFTLFSSSGTPLNERLVFIDNPEDKLNLTVNADKQSYSPRQKIILNIDAKDNGGKPAVGSFSIAVTDESKVPVDETSENNILANLLLTSDLKGYIEQPAYYFNNKNDKIRADLDALMLTQGYHRYEWQDVLSTNQTENKYLDQKNFTISGRVTTPSGSPVARGKVELINFDDGLLQVETLTDVNGRFAFNDVMFADSVKFLIQARNAKNKRDVVITMDSIPPPPTANYKSIADFKLTNNTFLTTYAQSSKALYYEQMKYGLGNHVISLREVIIIEKRNVLKHSANLNGPGNADQVFLAKDFFSMGCLQLGDCLQGRLLGVVFRNGIPYTTRGGGRMLVVIDGLNSSLNAINTLNVNDVQSIEVLRNIGSYAIYGSQGSSGVLVITTKRGDEPVEYPQTFGRGIKPYAPKGIYRSRVFYSPKYDVKNRQTLADLRTTIYWKPNIVTVGGKSSVDYFNAGKGNYRVVIEGIDSEGDIGRQVLRYKVE